jgi:hypothetical protein
LGTGQPAGLLRRQVFGRRAMHKAPCRTSMHESGAQPRLCEVMKWIALRQEGRL